VEDEPPLQRSVSWQWRLLLASVSSNHIHLLLVLAENVSAFQSAHCII
jgi:REP element-mobilizing transposase RayT